MVKRSSQLRWHFFAGLVIPVFTLIAKLRIVRGVLPPTGPFIIAPNHYSEIDPIVMGIVVWKLGRTPRFLAKASLFRVPVLGSIMRFTGQIPVERRSSATISEPLKAAGVLISQGSGLIVYPEGTLTKDPDLWPMKGKLGAVRMALDSGIPLYPAAHWGTQNLMGRYAKFIRVFPRARIDVVVGERLDLSAFEGKPITLELLEKATAQLMKEIASLAGELRGEKPPVTLHDGLGEKIKR
jgi:1-acyl-sn-glycerol-3-phosphate acyltransferase